VLRYTVVLYVQQRKKRKSDDFLRFCIVNSIITFGGYFMHAYGVTSWRFTNCFYIFKKRKISHSFGVIGRAGKLLETSRDDRFCQNGGTNYMGFSSKSKTETYLFYISCGGHSNNYIFFPYSVFSRDIQVYRKQNDKHLF